MHNESISFKKELQNDIVLLPNSIVSLAELAGTPTRKGLEMAVVSNGKIVNTVSKGYGHLANEEFFTKVEEKLAEANLKYETRSINRNDCSFAVDYILNDDKATIVVKNGNDKIRPMLRFVNSYDGSCKTSGSFGYFREVCSNGLHVLEKSKIGFSLRKRGDIAELVLPEIGSLVRHFIDNEFYTIRRRFEVLEETIIPNVEEFVKGVSEKTGLFKYEKSDKNPEPSKNAQIVIDTINAEARTLESRPNLWLGYNAFNELLHTELKKNFTLQASIDLKLFELVSDMATAQ